MNHSINPPQVSPFLLLFNLYLFYYPPRSLNGLVMNVCTTSSNVYCMTRSTHSGWVSSRRPLLRTAPQFVPPSPPPTRTALQFSLPMCVQSKIKLTMYFMEFLQIVFTLQQFIARMEGKTVPIVAYPPHKSSVGDEERVAIQKITTILEKWLQQAVLGLPGETVAERISIQSGYHKLSSRSAQFPYRRCPFGLASLRSNPSEHVHIRCRPGHSVRQ